MRSQTSPRRRRLTAVAVAATFAVAGVGWAGCGDDDAEGQAEDAANQAQEAIDDAQNEADDAVDDAGQAVEDAQDDAPDY